MFFAIPMNGIFAMVRLLPKAYRYLRPSRDELALRRWNQLIRANGLGNAEALDVIKESPKSLAQFARQEGRCDVSMKALRRFCSLVGVRQDWALGHDDQIYDVTCLDRDPRRFVDELKDWTRKGDRHTLLVFRSRTPEIEDDLNQAGALLLRRTRKQLGERELCEFRPIFSLRFWNNDKQRFLALRAMLCAHRLDLYLEGKVAGEKECEAIAEGKWLPTAAAVSGCCHWHPDDYVVRPSKVAKGGDWVAEIAADQALKELLAEYAVAPEGVFCRDA